MSTALRTYYRGHSLVAMRDEVSNSVQSQIEAPQVANLSESPPWLRER